jgi:hypothetical protein
LTGGPESFFSGPVLICGKIQAELHTFDIFETGQAFGPARHHGRQGQFPLHTV